MVLTLARALTFSPLDQCQVVAGAGGLDRIVNSVNVIDAPDQGPFIKGGEFLITSGYVVKDNVEDQIELFHHLNNLGCAGLGVKFKRYIVEPSEYIIKEANRLNFPLIEIPHDLPFSEIMLSLIREIVNDRTSENERARSNNFFMRLFRGELQGQDAILAEGSNFGIIPDCYYSVLNIRFNYVKKESYKSDLKIAIANFIQELSSKLGVSLLTADLDDVTILLQSFKRKNQTVTNDTVLNVANAINQRFKQRFPGNSIFIGIGLTQENVLGIKKSFKQAQEAIYIGSRINAEGEELIFQYTSLEAYTVLQSLSLENREDYIDVTLGKLISYDKKGENELIKTLEAYLKCGRKSLECAQQLHVHRNTIYFRLTKIKELLGVDIDDGEVGFRLQLALHMVRLNRNCFPSNK